MDEWIDGWMNEFRCMDGWMWGWMDMRMNSWISRWINGWNKVNWVGGLMYVWLDGWTDRLYCYFACQWSRVHDQIKNGKSAYFFRHCSPSETVLPSVIWHAEDILELIEPILVTASDVTSVGLGGLSLPQTKNRNYIVGDCRDETSLYFRLHVSFMDKDKRVFPRAQHRRRTKDELLHCSLDLVHYGHLFRRLVHPVLNRRRWLCVVIETCSRRLRQLCHSLKIKPKIRLWIKPRKPNVNVSHQTFETLKWL